MACRAMGRGMPRPWRKNVAGAKYHVTCRGNGRKPIFLAPEEWSRFREQLGHALACDGVRLYAWALMPNHYHLLVETPRANLPAFMRRLNTSYALYFGHKHQRPGHCFQCRYGAKLVGDDEYHLRLTRYIHLNPVCVKGMAEKSATEKWQYLQAYKWSSLRGSLRSATAEEDVSYDWLYGMNRSKLASCRRAYGAYVRACLGEADEMLSSVYRLSRYAIGDDSFVEGIEDEMRRKEEGRSTPSDLVRPAEGRREVDVLLKLACRLLDLAMKDLKAKGSRLGVDKAMVIELMCRIGGCSQRALGEYLGVSEYAIGKQRRRFALALTADPALRKIFNTRYAQYARLLSSV